MDISEKAMASASERIPVLVTPSEKAAIAKRAREAHLSMGEFLRRSAASYCPTEDEMMLEGMIQQMVKATAQAGAAIDDALAFVESSNKRIAALETERVS